MSIEILSRNYFLKRALIENIKSIEQPKCGAKLLIVDLTDDGIINEMKKINTLSVCAVIFFVKEKSESNLLKHINFIFPVKFIELDSPVNYVLQNINTIMCSLLQKKICNYTIANLGERSWVSSGELNAARLFFNGENTASIAKKLNVGEKTALSYVGLAMRKLEMNYSVRSYIMFQVYNELCLFFQGNHAQDINEICFLRRNYIKTAGFYLNNHFID